MISEAIDQIGHWLLGYFMGFSWRNNVREGKITRDQALGKIMNFAIEREKAQNPENGEDFGKGSSLDLKCWRKGAEKGIGK